jgi:uncharacterized protein (DUF1810 family)
MPERDPFNLDRFVQAQAQVFDTALAELQAGRKRSHWMWFVFPQLRGLGHSSMAQSYGIASLAEARAFLNHPVLGARLRQCTQAVVALEGRSLHDIFGSPDDLKFRSCMTLFERLEDGGDAVFTQALERCCQGCRDERTLALLG